MQRVCGWQHKTECWISWYGFRHFGKLHFRLCCRYVAQVHAPCDNDDTMIQNGKMTNYEHINDTIPCAVFATVRKGKKWIRFMIIIITLSLSLLASSPSYPVSFLSHQKWLIVFAHKLPFSQFHYHESKDENDQFPLSHFSITQFPIFKCSFVCIVQGDASRGDNH